MYSKEDRERILADLAASGLTAAAFARIPGNPSRGSLRKWGGRPSAAAAMHAGAEPSGHLCAGTGMDAQPRNSALCDFSSHRARSPHVCGFCFRMKQFLS